MKSFKYPFYFLILFCLPFQSFAWGLLGHRIVGQIAENHLTDKAKANIKKILGTESIAMAGNWADFIRSDTQYFSTETWHYINVADSLSHTKMLDYLKTDTTTDVFTKLAELVTELKNKKLSHNKQVFDLKFIIHLVGDLHEPMHVSREEDEGGNKIKVTWFGSPSNLHSVWDNGLINNQQLSYTEYTESIDYSTRAQRLEWQKAPIAEWIYESYIISQELYGELYHQLAPKLGYSYNFDHIATVNNQLLKGGIRLAGLLNNIFDY